MKLDFIDKEPGTRAQEMGTHMDPLWGSWNVERHLLQAALVSDEDSWPTPRAYTTSSSRQWAHGR